MLFLILAAAVAAQEQSDHRIYFMDNFDQYLAEVNISATINALHQLRSLHDPLIKIIDTSYWEKNFKENIFDKESKVR